MRQFSAKSPWKSFPEKDVHELLNRAGDSFSLWDKRAIRALAGGHPFLLQTAASMMWELHEEGITEMPKRRREMAQRIYKDNRWLFADTWRVWSPPVRKAMTTIGLAHTGTCCPGANF
ncbi:MAG: hypothetical protein U0401_28590 [Anaerolineae bacterium]